VISAQLPAILASWYAFHHVARLVHLGVINCPLPFHADPLGIDHGVYSSAINLRSIHADIPHFYTIGIHRIAAFLQVLLRVGGNYLVERMLSRIDSVRRRNIRDGASTSASASAT